MEQVPKRGGVRPGAGAPKKNPLLKKVQKGIKLPQWIIDWFGEQPESAAVLIENALIKVHKLKPPKE